MLVSAVAPALRAQTLGFSILPVTGSPPHGTAVDGGRQNFESSLGLLFSLNGSLTITSLGYWDDDATNAFSEAGVNASLTVAIFDRNASGGPAIVPGATFTFTGTVGTLVGDPVLNQWNSDVPATQSGRTGQFRIANLTTPVVLPAGQYALVAWGYNASSQFLNGSSDGPVLAPNSFGGILTFDGNAYDSSNPLLPGSYPTFIDLGNGVSGPLYTSATFGAVPEPADVALVFAATALLGAFLARRWQRARGAN